MNNSLSKRILAIGGGMGSLGVLSYLAVQGNEIALGAIAAAFGAIVYYFFPKAEEDS